MIGDRRCKVNYAQYVKTIMCSGGRMSRAWLRIYRMISQFIGTHERREGKISLWRQSDNVPLSKVEMSS